MSGSKNGVAHSGSCRTGAWPARGRVLRRRAVFPCKTRAPRSYRLWRLATRENISARVCLRAVWDRGRESRFSCRGLFECIYVTPAQGNLIAERAVERIAIQVVPVDVRGVPSYNALQNGLTRQMKNASRASTNDFSSMPEELGAMILGWRLYSATTVRTAMPMTTGSELPSRA